MQFPDKLLKTLILSVSFCMYVQLGNAVSNIPLQLNLVLHRTKYLNYLISRLFGAQGSVNIQGEEQQKLDILANQV
jgi:fructose-1,6-bisphosphatase